MRKIIELSLFQERLIAVHGRGVSRYNYSVLFWTDWEEN